MEFPNPIAGRPTSIETHALCLISPDIVLKLAGTSLGGILKEVFGESAYRGWVAATSLQREPTTKLENTFLASVPDDVLTRLGDTFYEGYLRKWYAFSWLRLADKDETAWPYDVRYICALELALLKAQQHVSNGRPCDLIQYMQKNSLLAPFIWPELTAALSPARKEARLRPARYAMFLEVSLSVLAASDIALQQQIGPVQESVFAPILPSDCANSTARLYDWLFRDARNNFLDIADELSAHGVDIDDSTLKRWRDGKNQPSDDKLYAVARAFMPKLRQAQIGSLSFAARYFNLLGGFSNKIQGFVRRPSCRKYTLALAPSPDLPFGHAHFPDWCRARYPAWIEYHAGQRSLVRA